MYLRTINTLQLRLQYCVTPDCRFDHASSSKLTWNSSTVRVSVLPPDPLVTVFFRDGNSAIADELLGQRFHGFENSIDFHFWIIRFVSPRPRALPSDHENVRQTCVKNDTIISRHLYQLIYCTRIVSGETFFPTHHIPAKMKSYLFYFIFPILSCYLSFRHTLIWSWTYMIYKETTNILHLVVAFNSKPNYFFSKIDSHQGCS